MAFWEDRSVPAPGNGSVKPRNHAEVSARIRRADANDPPGAPKPGPTGTRRSAEPRPAGRTGTPPAHSRRNGRPINRNIENQIPARPGGSQKIG